MASIQTSIIDSVVKGDTFPAVEFTFTGLDLTGASIRSEFRYNCKEGTVVLDVSNGSGITVTDAANGVIEIDKFTPITWAVGTYFYDIQITLASGDIKTYVQGTVKNIQDTTN